MLQVHHHRKPRLDVPCKRCDDHVGPVTHQVVQGHAQRVNSVLELLDDVLLVATLVGTPNHLIGAQIITGRDIEEIADFVEQYLLALHLADVLAQHYHPVVPVALARTVGELGNLFVVEPEVQVLSLYDDTLFLVALIPFAGLCAQCCILFFTL